MKGHLSRFMRKEWKSKSKFQSSTMWNPKKHNVYDGVQGQKKYNIRKTNGLEPGKRGL